MWKQLSDYLFLREVYGGEKVDSLLMAEINVVAKQEDEDEFTDILLLLVPIHPVSCEGVRV